MINAHSWLLQNDSSKWKLIKYKFVFKKVKKKIKIDCPITPVLECIRCTEKFEMWHMQSNGKPFCDFYNGSSSSKWSSISSNHVGRSWLFLINDNIWMYAFKSITGRTRVGIESVFLRILKILCRPCFPVILLLTGIKTKVLDIFRQKKSNSKCLAWMKRGAQFRAVFEASFSPFLFFLATIDRFP